MQSAVPVTHDIFHRYLTPGNRHEPQLVRKTGFVKGGNARVLAHGKRVNAYAGPHDPARDHYEFSTPVKPKVKLGFADGKVVTGEVYWPEGWPGVVDFPAEDKVGIPATVTKDPLP